MFARWEDWILGPSLERERFGGVQLADVSAETEQVWAQGALFDELVSLDPLVGFPNARSVVGDRVSVTTPLPHVTDMLVRKTDWDGLRNLPNLERLISGFDRSDRIELGDLPATVVDLGLLAARGKETVSNLPGLERLAIGSMEDAAPVASLERLRWLSISPAKGLHHLGRLTGLRRVSLGLGECRPTSLKAFSEWAEMRCFKLEEAGSLNSVEGIERWRNLERFEIRATRLKTFAPLEGLPALEHVELHHLLTGCDVSAVGLVPSLRHLVLFGFRDHSGVFETDSIGFLRGCDTLETVDLTGTVIRDGDLSPLLELPNLESVVLTGDYGLQLGELREKLGDDGVKLVTL